MTSSLLHFRSYIKELPLFRMLKQNRRKKGLLNEERLAKVLEQHINGSLSQKEKEVLVSDMKEKARLYGFSFDEYSLLQLWGRPEEQVREFISDIEHVEIVEKMNKAKNQAIFDDKALTYQHFKKYYKRSCIYAESSPRGVESLYDFVVKYKNVIVKPVEKAGGKDIEIIHGDVRDEVKASAEKLLNKYKYGVFIEELIQQVNILGKLHPTSVNTVRIPTIRVNSKETVIFHPCLRVGRGDSIVDNAGSGGIICALNPENGTVIAARDEKGNEFTIHPETGVRLTGFTVPEWDVAVNTAKELADIIPSNRYTAWDLALTEKGWVMVEANARGQFIWQYSTLQGCRSEINQLFNRMGISYKT